LSWGMMKVGEGGVVLVVDGRERTYSRIASSVTFPYKSFPPRPSERDMTPMVLGGAPAVEVVIEVVVPMRLEEIRFATFSLRFMLDSLVRFARAEFAEEDEACL